MIAIAVAAICTAVSGEAQETELSKRCPGLASGALMHAELAQLETGVLLRSGDILIRQKDLAEEIASYPAYLQDGLHKDRFLVLEELAAHRLLLAEAKEALTRTGKTPSQESDAAIVRHYLEGVACDVTVSEQEVKTFFEANRDRFGGASLEDLRSAIERFLLEEKKQQVVAAHVESIGQRRRIQIQSDWALRQYQLVKNNMINQARRSGKPVLVAFGGAACCGPDMTRPLLDSIKDRYGERLEVLYIEAQEEWCLAARCRVQSIPTLIVYDAAGQEAGRHAGTVWEEDVKTLLHAVDL